MVQICMICNDFELIQFIATGMEDEVFTPGLIDLSHEVKLYRGYLRPFQVRI